MTWTDARDMRAAGRAWFRDLARVNPGHAWDLGDLLVLGDLLDADLFGDEEPPWYGRPNAGALRRHFLAGVDEARILWEVMSC